MSAKRRAAAAQFKAGEFGAACETYLETLLGLDMKNADEIKNQRMKNELQIPILLNIGTCLHRQGRFESAE